MNPFLQNNKLRLLRVHDSYHEVRTNHTKEGTAGTYKEVHESYLVEAQGKTLVYYIPYIEDLLFNKLSSNGRDLLLYIIYNIKENTDVISLKLDKVSKEMQISRPTLIKGIKDLLSNGFIATKSQSEYWVNPHCIFKGNRVNYYNLNCPECVEIVKEIHTNKIN